MDGMACAGGGCAGWRGVGGWGWRGGAWSTGWFGGRRRGVLRMLWGGEGAFLPRDMEHARSKSGPRMAGKPAGKASRENRCRTATGWLGKRSPPAPGMPALCPAAPLLLGPPYLHVVHAVPAAGAAPHSGHSVKQLCSLCDSVQPEPGGAAAMTGLFLYAQPPRPICRLKLRSGPTAMQAIPSQESCKARAAQHAPLPQRSQVVARQDHDVAHAAVLDVLKQPGVLAHCRQSGVAVGAQLRGSPRVGGALS